MTPEIPDITEECPPATVDDPYAAERYRRSQGQIEEMPQHLTGRYNALMRNAVIAACRQHGVPVPQGL